MIHGHPWALEKQGKNNNRKFDNWLGWAFGRGRGNSQGQKHHFCNGLCETAKKMNSFILGIVWGVKPDKRKCHSLPLKRDRSTKKKKGLNHCAHNCRLDPHVSVKVAYVRSSPDQSMELKAH